MSFFQYDATLAPPVFSFIQDGSAHSASVHVVSGNGDGKVIGTSTDVEIIEASGTTTCTGAATSLDVSSDGTRIVVGTSLKMYVVNKSGGAWAQIGHRTKVKNYILNTKACTHVINAMNDD